MFCSICLSSFRKSFTTVWGDQAFLSNLQECVKCRPAKLV